MKPNPQVDFYFRKAGPWKAAVTRLRRLALDAGLTEELKWGVPCYTLDGRNVVLIHDFKHYCALLFHKGALLPDPQGLLVQQTKNVQAARQIRFTSADAVDALAPALASYLRAAMAVEASGRTVALKATADFEMPEEFQAELDTRPALRTAFAALTPGRQRAYLLHFSSAKQSKTRVARIEKCTAAILAGKGLDD